jgi:Ni/Co efflux regulator RcnB
MMRLLLSATAAAALATPLAAGAQPYNYGNGGQPYYDYSQYGSGQRGYYGDYDDRYYRGGHHHHRYWERGEYLPRDLRQNYVRDWRRHGLRPPADQNNGWFAVGDQFVMANFDNGLIAMAVPRD